MTQLAQYQPWLIIGGVIGGNVVTDPEHTLRAWDIKNERLQG